MNVNFILGKADDRILSGIFNKLNSVRFLRTWWFPMEYLYLDDKYDQVHIFENGKSKGIQFNNGNVQDYLLSITPNQNKFYGHLKIILKCFHMEVSKICGNIKE